MKNQVITMNYRCSNDVPMHLTSQKSDVFQIELVNYISYINSYNQIWDRNLKPQSTSQETRLREVKEHAQIDTRKWQSCKWL